MSDYTALERNAAGERQKLAASLDALAEAISPENVSTHAAQLAQSYGGDIGRQAWDAARQNPAAFALVGVGIGLLLTGTGSRPEAKPETMRPEPGHVPPQGDAKLRKEETGVPEPDTAPRAAWLRAKLNEGLDALPPAARARVIASRQAVLEAQEKVEARARAAAKKSQTFMHDQPLAVGALAAGLGALIGALLPATRQEDALLGQYRDAAMAKARATLREELDRVQGAADERLHTTSTATG